MKRFQLYKVVTNNRFLHCKSIVAESRIAAINLLKNENKNLVLGFNFWNYYVTGLTQTFPSHIKKPFEQERRGSS